MHSKSQNYSSVLELLPHPLYIFTFVPNKVFFQLLFLLFYPLLYKFCRATYIFKIKFTNWLYSTLDLKTIKIPQQKNQPVICPVYNKVK